MVKQIFYFIYLFLLCGIIFKYRKQGQVFKTGIIIENLKCIVADVLCKKKKNSFGFLLKMFYILLVHLTESNNFLN